MDIDTIAMLWITPHSLDCCSCSPDLFVNGAYTDTHRLINMKHISIEVEGLMPINVRLRIKARISLQLYARHARHFPLIA